MDLMDFIDGMDVGFGLGIFEIGMAKKPKLGRIKNKGSGSR